MPLTYQTIALVGRPDSEEIRASLLDLAHSLRKRGHTVLIDQDAMDEAQGADFTRIAHTQIGPVANLVIVLGGDGTLLGIARLIVPHNVPLIGVNQGRLGFMTDIAHADMLKNIELILDGHGEPEQRELLCARAERNGQVIGQTLALNDVVFNRGKMGAMIEFEIHINGGFVYSQRSDGLIVSTPTGSTAYALAAGGPILHPSISAMTLVPICPQSMTNRPIVVSSEDEVEFVLLRGQDCHVHFDGQTHIGLLPGDHVFIQRFDKKLSILHPPGYDYYHVLQRKLHWGRQLT